MDRRLRQLERQAKSGDPDAKARLNRLKCKLEGCLENKVLAAYRSLSDQTREYRFTIRLDDGRLLSQSISYRKMKTSSYIEICNMETEIIYSLAKQIAACPRCNKPNSLDDYYFGMIKEYLSGPRT